MNLHRMIKKHLLNRSVLSYGLYPLSLIYAMIIKIRRCWYSDKAYQCSNIKLICVGNISSGGTGKTPFVIFLAKYLQSIGLKPAIISRGYKGAFEHQNKIICDEHGLRPEASLAGDEPYLIARHLKNILIIVGKNRILSLEIIKKQKSIPDIVIFDDAFQHVKIRYDYTFLVFNGEKPVGNGFNLPAGILREPVSHTKLADFLVYNAYVSIPSVLKQFEKPVLRVQYQITCLTDIHGNVISDLAQKKIALLSAIGVPAAFEKTIRHMNINFDKHYIYPDHYAFNDMNEIEKIRQTITDSKTDYIICTEKDFSKLEKIAHNLPLLIACSEFKLASEDYAFLNLTFKTNK